MLTTGQRGVNGSAFGQVELFRIIQLWWDLVETIRVEPEGGGRHWACPRSASSLINANDSTMACRKMSLFEHKIGHYPRRRWVTDSVKRGMISTKLQGL